MAEIKEESFLEENEQYLVRASTGQRFGNYLIDRLAFYGIAIGFGVVLALGSPESLDALEDDSTGFQFLDMFVSSIAYGIMMGLIEGFTKGKSLGKLITGTRAVNLDGSTISFGTAFGRGFCRAIPFVVFSAFGSPCNPWQDSWTNTMVIDEKASGLR